MRAALKNGGDERSFWIVAMGNDDLWLLDEHCLLSTYPDLDMGVHRVGYFNGSETQNMLDNLRLTAASGYSSTVRCRRLKTFPNSAPNPADFQPTVSIGMTHRVLEILFKLKLSHLLVCVCDPQSDG